jgi:predicted HAD superfamily Cof-like phosphohydrolase
VSDLHHAGRKPPVTWGERVRYHRENAGKTMGDLARFLGVSVVRVSNLERNCSPRLGLDESLKIAAWLGIDARELGPVRGPMVSDIDAQVAQFHRAFGYPVRSVPAVPESANEIRLRLRLILEEFQELVEAHTRGDLFSWVNDAFHDIRNHIDSTMPDDVDLVATADALADLDYVIAGTRLTYGIPGAEVAAEVHASNMRKVGGKPDENGKLQKPDGWTPPNVEGVLRRAGWKP